MRYLFALAMFLGLGSAPLLAQVCTGTSGAPPTLRSEGRAELVGAVVLTCIATQVWNFDAEMTLNNGTVPITSRPGEAQIMTIDAAGTVTNYPGLLVSDPAGSPNNIAKFQNISVGAGNFVIQITGIRADTDPTYVPLNTGNFGQLLMTLTESNGPPPSSLNGGFLVGIVIPGMAPAAIAPSSVSACSASAGIPAGSISPVTINIPENFPTAFKTQSSTQLDSGSETGPIPGAMPANSGTQFAVTLDLLPAGVTLLLPLAIYSDQGGTAQLVNAEGSTTAVSTATLLNGVSVLPVTSAGTFFYNLTNANSGEQETFSVPVYVSAVPGTRLTIAPTVAVELAPRASMLNAAVPRFTALTTPVPTSPLFTVAACGPLSFNGTMSAMAPPQAITLSGPAGANFTAVASDPWITVTPASGTLPAQVAISVNPAGLTAQAYQGFANLSSEPAGVSPTSIPVTLNLSGQQITLTPTALAFSYIVSQPALPLPAGAAIAVSGLGEGMVFQATAIGAPWLTVSQTRSGDAGAISVQANPQGLGPGQYLGAIQVSAGSATFTVPVALDVSDMPDLIASPADLVFLSPQGSVPAPQNIGINAATATFTADAPWVVISTASSGALVSVNPAGLAAGRYHAEITIANPLFDPSQPAPIQVGVTLGIGSFPVPSLSAVSNAAGHFTGSLAPGSIVSLFGSNLGPATPAAFALTAQGTVPLILSDTQVFVSGIACPLLFAQANQVNAILPFGLAGQTSAMVQVVYQGVASNAFPISMDSQTPGIFSADGSGGGEAAALNQDGSINSSTNPAPAGTIVSLFATGAGVLSPSSGDGAITPLMPPFAAPVSPVWVSIAGANTAVTYAGSAPGQVTSLLQVNFLIPPGTASGAQPITLTVYSGIVSGVTLFVQ